MEISDLIQRSRLLLAARECHTITVKEMACRIGVNFRTYTEYERGTNKPLAMKALFNLLSMLEDDEIIKIVRAWQYESK